MFDVAELADRCQVAGGKDVSGASDQELFASAQHYAIARAGIDAGEGRVLAELEARGACDRDFGMNTATWYSHVTNGDRRLAATRVNVATKVRGRFAEAGAALARGEISFEHVRALTDAANPRIVDLIAAEQGEWIARAQREPFRAWHQSLRVHAELLDQDGGYDPDRDLARNTLTITPSGTDSILIRGELFGEFAIGVMQAIEAKADERFRQAVKDHAEAGIAVPPRATLRALALADLLRIGRAAEVATLHAPVVDVTLVMHDTEPDLVTTPDGEFWIAYGRLAHLCCVPDVTPLTMAVRGVVLDLGRTRRLVNRAQRRALTHRDGGCTFPGCGAPANWCDAHHVQEWEDGGPTDLANVALLCRRHHGVVHRLGWTMTANPDQTFTIKTPSGDVLTTQRHHGRPPPGG